MNLKDFLDTWRQSGSTTAGVKAAQFFNGIYVTANKRTKEQALKIEPRAHVVTLLELKTLRGYPKKPIFFDTTIVCDLCNDKKQILFDTLLRLENEISSLRHELRNLDSENNNW